MNTLESYEKKQLESLSSGKSHPSFSAGDTIKVHLKIKSAMDNCLLGELI